MSTPNRPLDTHHAEPLSTRKYWRTGALAILCLAVFSIGFHEEIIHLIAQHIDNYFKAQQALVDAQYFAC